MKNGNPNKTNASNETSLHCVCQAPANILESQRKKRFECLLMILQWKGAKIGDGQFEKVSVNSVDKKQNTPLHFAAKSGLKQCVEYLVSQNADLFAENDDKHTACDLAEKSGYKEIALYLESKMVFYSHDNENEIEMEMDDLLDSMENEGYSGLRAQDLQEAKDQLLVETSDMLRVPLFTAEALLRNHEWSRETLLESWMKDPILCCEKSGVAPPSCIYESMATAPPTDLSTSIQSDNVPSSEITCDVCTSPIPANEPAAYVPCQHNCCRQCWTTYLTVKIQEGDIHNITCPGYQCNMLIPAETIEELVSREMALKYLQFDIRAFVDSNPSINWCPHPGCGRAVKLPESDNFLSPVFTGDLRAQNSSDVSHSVDCGNGHMFCWECSGDPHEPASCVNWKKWHQKVFELRPETFKESIRMFFGLHILGMFKCSTGLVNGTEEELEVAANCLWLVTNSKPCPSCKSPIQKKEGCNHMKCSKCKHDFCWVCLESWKKHNSTTGGYFRCNRYDAVRKVEQMSEAAKQAAEGNTKRLQELNKFVHYYMRFKNHENSYKLEDPLLKNSEEKMELLAKQATDKGENPPQIDTRFVQDAVIQLLKARRVLKCSYVYGYYLDDGFRKSIFEMMQNDLEESTETLSQIIARPYLRTPRQKIIGAASQVQRKRSEFLTAVAKGVVPTDSSPTSSRRRLEDEDFRKTFFESLKESHVDPSNPWIKDPSGRHTNVTAYLDWPASDEEQEEQQEEGKREGEGEGDGDASESQDVLVCSRKDCTKKRAMNPRTKQRHQHCSITCMREDVAEREINFENGEQNFSNYDIDLQRAIEMSKMQYLAETTRNTVQIEEDIEKRFKQEEKDLQMAIQLSLQNQGEGEENMPQSLGAIANTPRIKPNTFGIIKDVNVTNLLFEGSNKTNHFESKDMKIRNEVDVQFEEEPSRISNEGEAAGEEVDREMVVGGSSLGVGIGGGISDLQLKDVIFRLNSLTANSEEECAEAVVDLEREEGPKAEKKNISYV
ncbi:DgyrCDS14303 [Dimorphilus gyrociliatus]|uniref:RBR-type E3 ubiquitin transferase n=1 Tax=Dimorphilus gyrociliatus TaxID=2664684 RepID=A0A7I8WDF0_9ANNE|nr:DgyrCDS14303 [Dimorphilus gyrociliatus]